MKKQIKVFGLVGLVVIVVLVMGIMFYRARKVEVEPEVPIIRIGAILPLTGHLSWFGEHGRNAALLLEEELNIQEKQVEIRIFDSKSLPKYGLSAYRKMVMENIRHVYVNLDPVSRSILPNIERDGVIMFAGSIDDDVNLRLHRFFSFSNEFMLNKEEWKEDLERQFRFFNKWRIEPLCLRK